LDTFRAKICAGGRPSHLKVPDGPRMARAALSRWAIDEPNVSKLT